MSEVKIPRMSNDCARCKGLIDTGAGSVVCPQREGCLRFKAERSATVPQVAQFIASRISERFKQQS